MKNILIATDGSPSANEAVAVGVELAGEHDAAVTFLHVLPADEYIIAGRGASALPRPHHLEMDESETALKDAAEAAESAGVSYSLERISGGVVDEIIAVADAKKADLIVVGSRGRGPVASAVLGSVSKGVLNHAKCPVLVVRGSRVEAEAAV
jgi:nucleotide-binding universal stress UspA family protein